MEIIKNDPVHCYIVGEFMVYYFWMLIDFSMATFITLYFVINFVPTDDPDHWILAFRAHSKSGINLWRSWTNANHHDQDPSIYFKLPVGCVTIRSDLSCDRFYKSQLLDNWTKIEQVKRTVVLYNSI